ncbi:MAG: hypothetical protein ABIS50_17510 [Luteolibacter sp.]|uniref:hypothetical protein n=1 Tax=Luteolibacter sp. TaxID=1962973 RepID=UPI003266053E
MQSFVITLIHGTFAPGAGWSNEEDSALRKALLAGFPDQVRCRSFNWSGKNTHEARLLAAAEFAAHQKAVSLSDAGIPNFVISHSHGGNVALYALMAHDYAPAGIITMGTPFITCGPRNLKSSGSFFRFASFVYSLAIVLFIGLLLLFPLEPLVKRYFAADWRIALGWLVIGYVCCAVAGCAFSVYRNFPKLMGWAAGQQERIITRLKLPEHPVPMLCIHVAGDEAGWWLKATQDLAELPYRAWKKRMAWGIFLLALAYGLWGHKDALQGGLPFNELCSLLAYAAMKAGLVVLSVAVFWQVLMVVHPRIVRSHSGAFGGEGFRDNWFARIGMSLVPEGRELSVTQHAAPPSGLLKKGKIELRHSSMYNDDAVAAEIVAWIRKRLGEVES